MPETEHAPRVFPPRIVRVHCSGEPRGPLSAAGADLRDTAAAAPLARVVIVEDEPAIANMYRLRLERDGYQVAWAADGRSGLELVRVSRPDLVLLDVRLPDVDGFQVLRQLAADPDLRTVPVVFLSNLGEPELVSAGLNLGARAFLIKSHVTPADLCQLLPQWLTDVPPEG